VLLGGAIYRCKIGEHIIPHPSVRRTQPRNWNARTPCVPFMSSDRTIVDAIKVAQDLLRQNLPPTHNLTDAATVMRFRELVRTQAIRSALDRSSDTLLTFALREVERVISDQSRTNRETINQLWDILDDPHLNKALGLPQNSRMTSRRSRF
jgi:hypothetical protein